MKNHIFKSMNEQKNLISLFINDTKHLQSFNYDIDKLFSLSILDIASFKKVYVLFYDDIELYAYHSIKVKRPV